MCFRNLPFPDRKRDQNEVSAFSTFGTTRNLMRPNVKLQRLRYQIIPKSFLTICCSKLLSTKNFWLCFNSCVETTHKLLQIMLIYDQSFNVCWKPKLETKCFWDNGTAKLCKCLVVSWVSFEDIALFCWSFQYLEKHLLSISRLSRSLWLNTKLLKTWRNENKEMFMCGVKELNCDCGVFKAQSYLLSAVTQGQTLFTIFQLLTKPKQLLKRNENDHFFSEILQTFKEQAQFLLCNQ